MKYLAICLLSVASLFTTAGAWPAAASQPNFAAPVMTRVLNGEGSFTDRGLAVLVAAALVGMQLRRRQKSLHMPRQLN